MAHLRWVEPTPLAQPLERPVILAAFEGWNDAGDAATSAVRYLRDRFDAEPIAYIDSEDFYDFSQVRPRVNLIDGVTREIEWPDVQITAARIDGGADLIFVLGHEPHLRWRTFCEQLFAIAERVDAAMLITLGSLLAEVSHTRDVPVIGAAYQDSVIQRLDLQRSNYEGPTGIVGVLHSACGQKGFDSASLWATVPTYVPGAPSPKATLALVDRLSELLRIGVPTPDLEIAAAAYERQVSELVDAEEDMRAYVQALESEADGDDDYDFEDGDFVRDDHASDIFKLQADGASTDELLAEVERFLREQD